MTRELAGEQLAPALSPRGTCACITGPQVADGKPSRTQGRPRPEHRKRRGSSAVPARGIRLRGATKLVSVYEVGGERGTLRGDMSTPQKRPPTRHYLLTTSDNRRYACLDDRSGGAVDGLQS